MKKLKPYCQTLEEEHKQQILIQKKEKALLNFLEKNIPDSLKEVMTYNMSNIGLSFIRCFFNLNKDIKIEQMQEILSFANKMKKKKWEFSKEFREDSGIFYYLLRKTAKYPNTEYLILFENAPNIDGCKIEKKTIQKEIYYSDCGELTKTF